jgi:hypothetical protein
MNEDWARLKRLVGKPNGNNHFAVAGRSSAEFPRTRFSGSPVSEKNPSETV